MSWSVGLMLVIVLAVGVPYLIAEVLSPPRDWLRRLHQLEKGRSAQRGKR